VTGRFVLPSGTPCELLAPPMPGVRDYHVLALDRPAVGADLAELAELAARIAQRLGRELADDPGAFTIVLNGAAASRRPWAHAHIIPVSTPAAKRRAFACLMLKGPLRRLPRLTSSRRLPTLVRPS
jgi:hypothetical protein